MERDGGEELVAAPVLVQPAVGDAAGPLRAAGPSSSRQGDVQQAGKYAVDSFPEEEHNPASDHNDFANVMSQQIMNRLVNCVNTGKKCKE